MRFLEIFRISRDFQRFLGISRDFQRFLRFPRQICGISEISRDFLEISQSELPLVLESLISRTTVGHLADPGTLASLLDQYVNKPGFAIFKKRFAHIYFLLPGLQSFLGHEFPGELVRIKAVKDGFLPSKIGSTFYTAF